MHWISVSRSRGLRGEPPILTAGGNALPLIAFANIMSLFSLEAVRSVGPQAAFLGFIPLHFLRFALCNPFPTASTNHALAVGRQGVFAPEQGLENSQR